VYIIDDHTQSTNDVKSEATNATKRHDATHLALALSGLYSGWRHGNQSDEKKCEIVHLCQVNCRAVARLLEK
jgi:hypothetical protein